MGAERKREIKRRKKLEKISNGGNKHPTCPCKTDGQTNAGRAEGNKLGRKGEDQGGDRRKGNSPDQFRTKNSGKRKKKMNSKANTEKKTKREIQEDPKRRREAQTQPQGLGGKRRWSKGKLIEADWQR